MEKIRSTIVHEVSPPLKDPIVNVVARALREKFVTMHFSTRGSLFS